MVNRSYPHLPIACLLAIMYTIYIINKYKKTKMQNVVEEMKKEAHRKECEQDGEERCEFCRDTAPSTDRYEYGEDGLPNE